MQSLQHLALARAVLQGVGRAVRRVLAYVPADLLQLHDITVEVPAMRDTVYCPRKRWP